MIFASVLFPSLLPKGESATFTAPSRSIFTLNSLSILTLPEASITCLLSFLSIIFPATTFVDSGTFTELITPSVFSTINSLLSKLGITRITLSNASISLLVAFIEANMAFFSSLLTASYSDL